MVRRLLTTSAAMVVVPLGVLYAVRYGVLPAMVPDITDSDATLYGGLAAVVSVNAVIAVYAYLAYLDDDSDARRKRM